MDLLQALREESDRTGNEEMDRLKQLVELTGSLATTPAVERARIETEVHAVLGRLSDLHDWRTWVDSHIKYIEAEELLASVPPTDRDPEFIWGRLRANTVMQVEA